MLLIQASAANPGSLMPVVKGVLSSYQEMSPSLPVLLQSPDLETL